MAEVICKICGKSFIPAHKNSKLCSEECKKESRKLSSKKQTAERREINRALMGTRFCEVCGKEFPIKNWNMKRCSKECTREQKRSIDRNNKRKKREQVAAVAKQKKQKQIPLVCDSVKAQKEHTTYGKYAIRPYLAKQSEEMAKRRRELDAEWEKKRNEKKNL